MQKFFSEEEYRQRKEQIKDKAVGLQIKGIFSAGALLGAMFLAITEVFKSSVGSSPTMLMELGLSAGAALAVGAAGAAVLGGIAAYIGIKAHKEALGLQMEVQDLDAKRHAHHLQMSFGDKNIPQEALGVRAPDRSAGNNVGWADKVAEYSGRNLLQR